MSQLPMGLGIVVQVRYPFIQPLLQQLLTYNFTGNEEAQAQVSVHGT